MFMLFNKENPNWKKGDEGWNLLFLRTFNRYLNELLRSRGYLYENEIYEGLGFKWNPENTNRLFLYDKHYQPCVELEIFSQKNGNIKILMPEPNKIES